MIKYADRGLIKDGKLPTLFKILYLLISVVFHSQFLLARILAVILSDSFYEKVLHAFKIKIITEEMMVDQIKYFITLMCTFFTLHLIMSLGIFYSKRKLKKPHYRQNIFTFNSTLCWGLLHFGLIISLYLTLIFMNSSFILSVMRFLMIISQIIKYIVTLIENKNYLPELFSDIMTTNQPPYFNRTSLCPRPETFMPLVPFRQNAR